MRATPFVNESSSSCWNSFIYDCKCYDYRLRKEILWNPHHIAYPMALIHSTCSSNLQNVNSKLPTHTNTPTAAPRFKNCILQHKLRYRENQQFYWNWETLVLQSSSFQSPKFNVDNQWWSLQTCLVLRLTSRPEVIGVTFFDSCSWKSDSSSCSGAHDWKFTLRLLFALRKLENRVYFATWGKITAWTILPLANMDEYCHAFSAGKQEVVSCLCWSTAGFPNLTHSLQSLCTVWVLLMLVYISFWLMRQWVFYISLKLRNCE